MSRRRSAARPAELADAQTLETRLLLTHTFGFDIISSATVDAGSVSVNDFGDVTFMDSKRAFVGDGTFAPIAVNSNLLDANLIPNPGLQINNSGQVAETTSGFGPGNPRADRWDGLAAPTDGDRIALGAPSQFYFKNIAPVSSLANDGQVAFAGHNGIHWEVHLSDARVDAFSPDTMVTTFPTGTAFTMAAGSGDRVVIGSELGGIETIELFDLTGNNTSTVVATTTSAIWNDLGANPGISDDGSVVVFYGDLTSQGATLFGVLAGPGIFASVPSGRSLTQRTLIRVDGDLGRSVGGASIDFASFAADSRVNVLRQEYGRAGINDDALVVSYIATPNAASPPGAANDPLVFTANTGIWSSRVDIFNIAARDYRRDQPFRVIQVGGALGSNTVTAVSLHDGLATPLESPGGQAMLHRRGDHYLAFQADTASGVSSAVRANYLLPNTTAAAVPPRKTRFTGPILLADDLTPTVTWADLPHVSVDTWDLLGYHILSGSQVINLQVAGSQTSITMPNEAALGTHEFWIRGRNAAGAEPWVIEHRFYFHVVAPAVNPTTVEVTGPISSVFDATPHVSWDAFPNAATYDGLIYSINRGVEVARFEGETGTAFELPSLPTQETYSVHVRANTNSVGTTAWSRSFVFRIDLSTPPLQAPTNINPSGITNLRQPLFTWTGPPGAWEFETEFARLPTGRPQAVGLVHDSVFQVPAPVVAGPYIFSVRARNDALEFGDWGSAQLLIVSADANEATTPETPGDDLPTNPTFGSEETLPVAYYSEKREAGLRPLSREEIEQLDDAVTEPVERGAERGVDSAAMELPVEFDSTTDEIFAGWSDSDAAAGLVADEHHQYESASAAMFAALLMAAYRERRMAGDTLPTRSTANRGRRAPKRV